MFTSLRVLIGLHFLVASILTALYLINTHQIIAFFTTLREFSQEQYIGIVIVIPLFYIGMFLLAYPKYVDNNASKGYKFGEINLTVIMLITVLILLFFASTSPTFKIQDLIPVLIMATTSLSIITLHMALGISKFAFQVFSNSIDDPKDRYTILLGIFATIISLIAIFK
ncbi:hypothetical protein PWEIH_00535 [Listeria weihenstephanensis FSL R9-0317]|uniref:Uncharacterized protein n=1 Tax=Listeria weihenstephanensis TaxID=1006155 RepID=A0A3B6XHE0_9LIST|nr:hypothetical protein [Listeria weihenstephanensis]AQY50487.1 hypothetical protein UE46_05230 [Listeria phage LWP01] [Listeria weihenstephanensis]AQY52631.1 hypothetical protein UE46_p05230 [Listeria phage LWP01]EUJ41505.1 hypothetical protein PWEIH_00535 [Listeria weihenstephanensis FSL R9-0317]